MASLYCLLFLVAKYDVSAHFVLLSVACQFGLNIAKDESVKTAKFSTRTTETNVTKAGQGKDMSKRDRAALFSEPRIFPFLENLFNPVALHPPPVIVNPLPPVTGGGSVGHYHGTYHSATKPSCALNGLYCLYDSSYPRDKVKSIVDRFYVDVKDLYAILHRMPTNELLYYDNKTNSYRDGGHFVCESRVHYVRPGWARSIRGEWLVVINSDSFPQIVRVEECKYANRRCEYLPPCYKSTCVQRFSFQKLLCVDPLRPASKPFVEIFEIPTACSCFVENFLYY